MTFPCFLKINSVAITAPLDDSLLPKGSGQYKTDLLSTLCDPHQLLGAPRGQHLGTWALWCPALDCSFASFLVFFSALEATDVHALRWPESDPRIIQRKVVLLLLPFLWLPGHVEAKMRCFIEWKE